MADLTPSERDVLVSENSVTLLYQLHELQTTGQRHSRAFFGPARAAAWARQSESRARSPLSPYLCSLYRLPYLRRPILSLAMRLESGQFFSATLRDILRIYHGVTVGRYSYGGCLRPGYLPTGTTVGNYSTVSSVMRIYRRNHPLKQVSSHPFFFNHKLGLLDCDTIPAAEDNPLHIGHDVWIGHQTVILPRCRAIGDGAAVGAGAVVTHDVEPFTVVAGSPARVIHRRFQPDVEEVVRRSKWWLKTLPDLIGVLDAFVNEATRETVGRLSRLSCV